MLCATNPSPEPITLSSLPSSLPLQCCLHCRLLFHHHIIMVSSSLFRHRHHCSAIAIALSWCCSRRCSVAFIIMVLHSSLRCCSHCCGVAFIVTVLHSLLHCRGVKLIGTAERAVTAKPKVLNGGLGLLSHWPLRVVVCGGRSMSKG